MSRLAPELSVIMVAYNSAEFIATSVRALESSSHRIQLIAIDNSPDHDSLPAIKEVVKDAVLIPSPANLGFAKAVNIAFASAEAEFVMLLNPDCVIDGVDVDRLLARIRSDSSVGIIGPTIHHPGGRLTVRSAGFEPTVVHMLCQLVGLPRWKYSGKKFRGFNLYPAGEDDGETLVDWVSGACLITRRGLWNQTGGLSEKWFMYAEDIEFCRRAREHGLKVVHSSLGRAEHVVGASSETASGPVWTLWIDNLAEYYIQEFAPSRPVWLAWRLATWATFWSRAQVYGAKSLLPSGDASAWAREKEKFTAYSVAALKRRALSPRAE